MILVLCCFLIVFLFFYSNKNCDIIKTMADIGVNSIIETY